MTLPGETEAGSAGMQPCRGIAWWAHRDDVAGRGSSPFALCPKPYRIGRPLCLENPRPEGAEYSLTESAPSPFHAEPEHFGLSRQIRRGIEFNLSLDNLTDRDYYETQNYFDSRLTPDAPIVGRIHGTPGYPLTAIV